MFYSNRINQSSLVRYALFFVTVGVFVFFYNFNVLPCFPTEKLKVEKKELKICKAVTNNQQKDGLSNSLYLPKSWGMLFVFRSPGQYKFWMPDMYYAIDIFWLDKNLKIVSVKREASAKNYPELYAPVADAYYVLETRVGVILGDYPHAITVKN